MNRALVEACLPWLATLIVCVAVLRVLVAISGGRLRLSALRRLPADETGAVQSLSFVLTLPLFIMIMMLIVQVSQLMVATIVVHYAAFAAARSAIVWIPAHAGSIDEPENRISMYVPDAATGIDGPGTGYTILPGSPKYRRIQMAAALACAPIAPSRDVGETLPPAAEGTLNALEAAYQALAPESAANAKISDRLRNKLAYSLENTRIRISFLHKESEPPLAWYDIPPDRGQFYYNEVGWQDPIRVTVTHDLALLPGPGRLLARPANHSVKHDPVSESIEKPGNVYVRSLTASVTLGNEGETSVLSYVQPPQALPGKLP